MDSKRKPLYNYALFIGGMIKMICEKINLIEGRGDVSLTTYILEDSPEMLDGKNRGAVIICPGGGYLGCSDREGEPVAMAFAAMGYHAFVLRYSVYNESGKMSLDFSKPIPVKERSVFPNPMLDIGRAMLHIRKNAEAWHVNTDMIAICGFSAGGHNCAMYSVSWSKPVLTGYFGVNAEMLRPAACILGYPVTDYFLMKSPDSGDPFAKGLHYASSVAIMGTAEPSEDKLLEVSPARLINKDTPPTFIWSTFEDALVPVQQSALLVSALAEHGIPFEAHFFEKGPHGLSTATHASSGAVIETDADAAGWVGLCNAWLMKRFTFQLLDTREWQK